MAGRIKTLLDQMQCPPSERREIYREALRRGREDDPRLRGNGILMVVGGAMAISVIATALAGFVGFAPHVAGMSSLVGLGLGLALSVWVVRRVRHAWLWPHLVKLLRDRGEPVCTGCGYLVSRGDSRTEYCPECGRFITQVSDVDTALVPVITWSEVKKGIPLVHDLELSPAKVERLFADVNAQASEATWIARVAWNVLPFAAIFVLFFAWSLLKPSVQRLIPGVSWTVLSVGAFIVMCLLAAVFVHLLVRRLRDKAIRRIRAALRSEGTEVCLGCGQFLGESSPEQDTCPRCGAGREPMAGNEDGPAQPETTT